MKYRKSAVFYFTPSLSKESLNLIIINITDITFPSIPDLRIILLVVSDQYTWKYISSICFFFGCLLIIKSLADEDSVMMSNKTAAM